MLSVVGVVSTSASIGGAEFKPLVFQKTTKTRTRLFEVADVVFQTVFDAFG